MRVRIGSGRINRTLLGGLVAGAAVLCSVGSVQADHASETLTLSKSEGVTDGETVTLNFAGMLKPGETTVLAIMANTFPVVGPDAFNLEEFDPSKTYPVNPDGTGAIEFVANIDHGTFNCLEIQCYVVVFQGIGNDSYTAGAPINFAGAGAETVPATEPPVTEPPVTEPAATEPPATEPAVVETAPAETTPPEASVTAEADGDAEGDDDGGGSGGLIIGIIAALAVVGGGAAFLLSKKKKS
jgi:hypothetical protein